MVGQDSHLKEVFKEPPLTAFRRQQNIRGHLIRAKIAKNQRNKRILRGMKKCGTQCTACAYIKEGTSLEINKSKWKINKAFNCKSYNVIYAIFCKKDNCQKVYIGETKRMLHARVADHRGYVTNKVMDKSTGQHFNSPGHSLSDMEVTVIEQTKRKGTEYRKEREHYFIRRFDTFYRGLNKQK